MKLIYLFAMPIYLLLFYACSPKEQGETTEGSETQATNVLSPSLVKSWEVGDGLLTPESVCFDPSLNRIYVANINGDSKEKDGNGFISLLSPSGELLEAAWCTGLDAPKGMAVLENRLFVTDIDQLVAIDLETGEITDRYEVEGAKFLNDVTVDASSKTIYFSDSDMGRIHTWNGGMVSTFLEGEGLKRPNGLFFEKSTLWLASSGEGKLKKIDLASKQITPVAEGMGAGDGIVPDGEGNYLMSNWNGEVFFIDAAFSVTKILDTKEEKINSADIDYIPSLNLLIVPTFFDNRVVAYTLQLP